MNVSRVVPVILKQGGKHVPVDMWVQGPGRMVGTWLVSRREDGSGYVCEVRVRGEFCWPTS